MYTKRGDFLKKKRKITLKKLFFTVVIFLLIALIFTALFIYFNLDKEIDISLLKSGETSVTKVYYWDFYDRKNRIGTERELAEEAIFSENFEWKSIYELPDNLKNAFISIEDKKFYTHKGVDWLRTAKATLNYLFKFDKNGYGGSTITQQLIKNVTGENDFSPKRKLEEIFRSINLEKNLSKNQILESYLNVVYMSQNCYGVGAASKLYFNKDVSELTLAECASLATIVQNPTKYDPYLNEENNIKRRKVVLSEMLKDGYISIEDYKAAINEKVRINKNVLSERSSGIYSWYTEAMIEEICTDMAEKYNLNKGAARNLIQKGGYKIYSAIDPNLQKYAENIYKNYRAYIDNDNGKYPESACVVIDPYTNDVLAIVGGTGEKTGNLIFNRAISAKRPPGSTLKPLSVYAPGIEENIFNYSTVFDDTPILNSNGNPWPKNSPDKYRGLIPLCFALEHSVNTVAVKALNSLGIERSMDYLNHFGIRYSQKNDFNESSLALGQLTNGESLLNLTNAYTAFANGGKISKPKTYLKLTDFNGNVILENDCREEQVISEQSAFIMTKMLQKVVQTGTASFINLKNLINVAGKTGTSSNNEDKWFVGYTPYFVCGVWTGYDTPKPMSYTKNPSCVIFDKIMDYAHKNLDCNVNFDKPYGIIEQEFCFDSGLMPKVECSIDLRGERVDTGYYKKECIPKEECDKHKLVYIDPYDGKITNSIFVWRKRKAALVNYKRMNLDGIRVLDSEYLLENRK